MRSPRKRPRPPSPASASDPRRPAASPRRQTAKRPRPTARSSDEYSSGDDYYGVPRPPQPPRPRPAPPPRPPRRVPDRAFNFADADVRGHGVGARARATRNPRRWAAVDHAAVLRARDRLRVGGSGRRVARVLASRDLDEVDGVLGRLRSAAGDEDVRGMAAEDARWERYEDVPLPTTAAYLGAVGGVTNGEGEVGKGVVERWVAELRDASPRYRARCAMVDAGAALEWVRIAEAAAGGGGRAPLVAIDPAALLFLAEAATSYAVRLLQAAVLLTRRPAAGALSGLGSGRVVSAEEVLEAAMFVPFNPAAPTLAPRLFGVSPWREDGTLLRVCPRLSSRAPDGDGLGGETAAVELCDLPPVRSITFPHSLVNEERPVVGKDDNSVLRFHGILPAEAPAASLSGGCDADALQLYDSCDSCASSRADDDRDAGGDERVESAGLSSGGISAGDAHAGVDEDEPELSTLMEFLEVTARLDWAKASGLLCYHRLSWICLWFLGIPYDEDVRLLCEARRGNSDGNGIRCDNQDDDDDESANNFDASDASGRGGGGGLGNGQTPAEPLSAAREYGECSGFVSFDACRRTGTVSLGRAGMDALYRAVDQFSRDTVEQLALCARHEASRLWLDRRDVALFCSLRKLPLDGFGNKRL